MAPLAGDRQRFEADERLTVPRFRLVALPAEQGPVGAFELEAGIAVVIESDPLPAQHRVALLARQGRRRPRKLAFVGIAVAGGAGRWRPLHPLPFCSDRMAAPAGHALVAALQGEVGAVVIEDHPAPALQGMAGLAPSRGDEAVDFPLVGIAVAGAAGRGGETELDFLSRSMTGNAGHRQVGAFKRETPLLVVRHRERRRRESLDRVAALAGRAAGASRELSPVSVAVAVGATIEFRDAHRFARRVAFLTGQLAVSAAQGKTRP